MNKMYHVTLSSAIREPRTAGQRLVIVRSLAAGVPIIVWLLALLLTDASAWAVLCLTTVFFSDAVSRRIPMPGTRWQPLLAPLYVAFVAAVPVVAAMLIAQLGDPAGSPYYQ